MYGIGQDLPVCIAYLVLGFSICTPLQEEGDCPKMAIPGRIVEGCIPNLQQQQRDRDRSGQVRSGQERKGTEGQVRVTAVRCGRRQVRVGQVRVGQRAVLRGDVAQQQCRGRGVYVWTGGRNARDRQIPIYQLMDTNGHGKTRNITICNESECMYAITASMN